MKCVLDTTAYSELVRGHVAVADAVKQAEAIFLPNVVMAELAYGFRLGSRLAENERLLHRFIVSNKVHVLLPDMATTDYFAAVALYARRKGIQLSLHDIWIAALAEQRGATLVTFDNDFKHLNYPRLKLQLES